MAADSHGGEECLRYGEGSPLYVTHFLYHIPRLYCVSSECFLCLAQTAAHSSSVDRNKQGEGNDLMTTADGSTNTQTTTAAAII